MPEARLWLRAHLELARLSNLPTVWSNCVAAWLLVGGVFVPSLLFMTIALSLLYTGGMYLNDACDAGYDAEHRPERPIPRGDISRAWVFIAGGVSIAGGLALAAWEGWKELAMAGTLTVLIVGYDLFHRRLAWSPFLIAACRLMVYLTINVAAATAFSPKAVLWGVTLAAYVVGLSYVAKVEAANALTRYGPLALTFPAGLINLYPTPSATRWVLSLILGLWLGYCLFYIFRPRRWDLRRAVAGLIAGIALVDLMAVSQTPEPFLGQLFCIGCFALSLFLQRLIPAT